MLMLAAPLIDDQGVDFGDKVLQQQRGQREAEQQEEDREHEEKAKKDRLAFALEALPDPKRFVVAESAEHFCFLYIQFIKRLLSSE